VLSFFPVAVKGQTLEEPTLVSVARLAERETVRHSVPRPGGVEASQIGSLKPVEKTNSPWLLIGSLAGLITLALMCLVMRRGRLMNVGEAPLVRVLARTSLGPRHAVHLVRIGDQTLLVGTGPQGAPTLLAECDLPQAPAFAELVPPPREAVRRPQ
jgi:flagellar biogenesis protein FliO